MSHEARVAVRWVARTLGALLVLAATLFVLFLLTNSSRQSLPNDLASSVSNAPGP